MMLRTVAGLTVTLADGSVVSSETLELDAELSAAVFERCGKVRRIDVRLTDSMLFTQSER